MTDDRYDAWRAMRRAPEPTPTFTARVLASVAQHASAAPPTPWDRATVRIGLGALGGLALAFRLVSSLSVLLP